MQNEPAANAVELNRLLGPEGEETEEWKEYWWVDFRARHNKWVQKNGILLWKDVKNTMEQCSR